MSALTWFLYVFGTVVSLGIGVVFVVFIASIVLKRG